MTARLSCSSSPPPSISASSTEALSRYFASDFAEPSGRAAEYQRRAKRQAAEPDRERCPAAGLDDPQDFARLMRQGSAEIATRRQPAAVGELAGRRRCRQPASADDKYGAGEARPRCRQR